MSETVPAYSSQAVREAERPLLEAGSPLMARAAAALADVVRTELVQHRHPRVLVLAGRGDNGGDALFAAESLAETGMDVDAVLTSGDAHIAALAAATAAGVRRIEPQGLHIEGYDLIVDGILGIGARGALRGAARETVAALLESGLPPVVAVDIPSGLDPDDGTADDVVLAATVTVTFGAAKLGLTRGAGPRLAGRIVVVDLGLELPGSEDVAEVDVTIAG